MSSGESAVAIGTLLRIGLGKVLPFDISDRASEAFDQSPRVSEGRWGKRMKRMVFLTLDQELEKFDKSDGLHADIVHGRLLSKKTLKGQAGLWHFSGWHAPNIEKGSASVSPDASAS